MQKKSETTLVPDGGAYFIPELPVRLFFALLITALFFAVLVSTAHHAAVVDGPPSTHGDPHGVQTDREANAAETSQKSRKYAGRAAPYPTIPCALLCLTAAPGSLSGPAAAPSPASRTRRAPSGSANATTPTSSPSFTNPTTALTLKHWHGGW